MTVTGKRDAWRVFKFGGSSVADAACMRQVASIVEADRAAGSLEPMRQLCQRVQIATGKRRLHGLQLWVALPPALEVTARSSDGNGWLSPTGDEFLVHRVGGQWLIALGVVGAIGVTTLARRPIVSYDTADGFMP